MTHTYKKILILWSWALKIGEAGEFDYSGSQAIKAVKEEWIHTVLINPNIATVQTDPWFADTIYFLPVTPYFVEKVIEKEQPDALMLSFGGQTALNCGVALYGSWILEKHGVEVLWTPIEAIEITEDRSKFKKALDKVGAYYATSKHASTVKEATGIANEIGYPVLVRAAFALGGLGSGFVHNDQELEVLLEKSFSYSSQVIIDESLKGWKEVEYEVVRDAADNCITVCNMENVDPMGIHTWESIVVAPSQTLSNEDYQILRDVAIRTIRHLWIIGECNIQYAYNPSKSEYRVIEVNARLSRSSALASKATWYPLAYVAAKIALWYTLDEIRNDVTGVTSAFFEPALDYIVVKYPKWDLQKFTNVATHLWSEMKSVGEVMSIGKTFEEAMQKAIRNLHVWAEWLLTEQYTSTRLDHDLMNPTPERMFYLGQALQEGYTVDRIHDMTGIDRFFLHKLHYIVQTGKRLRDVSWVLDIDLLRTAKLQWFSDKQIAVYTKHTEQEIRQQRKDAGITPVVKQIDTLAGEFPAQTNYLYTTYAGTEHDVPTYTQVQEKKILVLWSGAYRIGSSVEFDRCSVNVLKTLKQHGYKTIMLNFNPETVSTDYTSSDSLYFDEISLEKILDIIDVEQPYGVIVSMGWQVANNLALPLKKAGAHILWTDPEDIDRAEDRNKFSALLDSIGVQQPDWREITSIQDSLDFAQEVSYPVLIRPSYVLSWANMKVCSSAKQLCAFLEQATDLSKEHPAVISKFEEWSKELEIDGVAQDGELIIYAIGEHIENAWVHSGDATIAVPAQRLYVDTVRKVKHIAKRIIKQLAITWPFNIQFLAKSNGIKVIECNLRSSRSFPFVSKTTKYNFIDIATKAMLGYDVAWRYNTLDLDYVGIKASQFSFHRLKGADPRLWVEMASTGEVGCLWTDIHQAFLKAMLSVWLTLPKKNILVSIGWLEAKLDFLANAKRLVDMGYILYATPGTHAFFQEHNVPSIYAEKIQQWTSWSSHDIMELIQSWIIDFIINEPSGTKVDQEETSWYLMRRKAVDLSIPLLVNVKMAKLLVQSLQALWGVQGIEILSYNEFI